MLPLASTMTVLVATRRPYLRGIRVVTQQKGELARFTRTSERPPGRLLRVRRQRQSAFQAQFLHGRLVVVHPDPAVQLVRDPPRALLAAAGLGRRVAVPDQAVLAAVQLDSEVVRVDVLPRRIGGFDLVGFEPV